jgi:hypothetical protein
MNNLKQQQPLKYDRYHKMIHNATKALNRDKFENSGRTVGEKSREYGDKHKT